GVLSQTNPNSLGSHSRSGVSSTVVSRALRILIEAPQPSPMSPSSAGQPASTRPATQLPVSVMPYALQTCAMRVHPRIADHESAVNGADPTCTRRSVPFSGLRAILSASFQIEGTDDKNVISCSSMIAPSFMMRSGLNGG